MSGITGWTALSDRVLAGIVHSLNNRIAALEATLLTFEPGDSPDDLVHALTKESDRLKECVATLRTVVGEPNAAAEPCTIADLFAQAAVLARYHPELRDLTFTLDDRGASPVRLRARRAAHALLVLLASARRSDDRSAVVVAEGNDEWTNVSVPAPQDIGSAVTSARELVEPDGGTVALEHERIVIRLPTLATVRKWDREKK